MGLEPRKKGRIVIITANSPEFVAAKAGAKASFGTNPLCFACPVEGRSPFVFDMSTAAIALFGVLTCKAKGQPLPQNSAYDANGNWTRKVEDIHIGGGGGAIANFGGHKGTGLALMVELLCAALAGGAVLGQDVKKTAKNWGHHVIAIDPDAMADGFAGRAASIIKTVAASHSPKESVCRATRRTPSPRRTRMRGPSPCPSASGTSSRRRRPRPRVV